MNSAHKYEQRPVMISVIIPTCHRNDLLARCLECLQPGAQVMAFEDYEIIVSDDGTRTTAEQMMRERFPWAKWVAGPRRGPAANRNSGARHAAGEWLAFMDDDCLPHRTWLRAIRESAMTGAEVVEGKTITPDKVDNPFRQGVENLRGGVFWSCNLSIRREQFFSMGGFDEDFLEAGGEDMEFAYRIRSRQLRSVFCPSALVLHPSRTIGFRQLIWRTFLIRWILLYYQKTGQGVAAESRTLSTVWFIVRQRTLELLRTTWHLASRFEAGNWRTRLFFQSWKWMTFPVVLPYLIYWGLRFRKQSHDWREA